MATWVEIRRAALQGAAANVLRSLAARYGKSAVEKALAGRPPAAMTDDDRDALDGAQRELSGSRDRIEDVTLSQVLDAAAEMLVGPSKPGERAPFDRALDRMTAAEIDRFGRYRNPEHVEVEDIADTLPAPSGSTSTPGAAPEPASEPEPAPPTDAPAAAAEPAKSKPSRPVVPWGAFAERREAMRILGSAPTRHKHTFVDGVCSVLSCKLACTHATVADHRCTTCGVAFDSSTCAHAWLRGRCRKCGKQG